MYASPHYTNRRRRALLACLRCREKKVRCCGQFPMCQRCNLSGAKCVYDVEPYMPLSTEQAPAFDAKLHETVRNLQKQLDSLEKEVRERVDSTKTDRAKRQRSDDNSVASERVWLQQRRPVLTKPINWSVTMGATGVSVVTNAQSLTDLYRALRSMMGDSIRIIPTSVGIQKPYTKRIKSMADEDKFSEVDVDEEDAEDDEDACQENRPMLDFWKLTYELSDGRSSLDLEDEVPKAFCDFLVDVFFCCYYNRCPFVNRRDFLRRYHDPHATDPIDPLLLNSLFAFVCRHACTYHSHDISPEKANALAVLFRNRARTLLEEVYDRPSLTSTQALMVNAYVVAHAANPGLAFLYYSLAIQHAYELATLGPPDGGTFTPQEREILRRLLWMAYMADEELGTCIGHVTIIEEEDLLPLGLPEPLPEELEDEEEDFVEYFRQEIALIQIRRRIWRTLFSSGVELTPEAIQRLDDALLRWIENLPSRFGYVRGQPYTSIWPSAASCMLHAMFYNARIAIYQPYLPRVYQSPRNTPTKPSSTASTTGPTAINSEQTSPSTLPDSAFEAHALRICTDAANMLSYLLREEMRRGICLVNMESVEASNRIHFGNLTLYPGSRRAIERNLRSNLRFAKTCAGYFTGLPHYRAFGRQMEEQMMREGIPIEVEDENLLEEEEEAARIDGSIGVDTMPMEDITTRCAEANMSKIGVTLPASASLRMMSMGDIYSSIAGGGEGMEWAGMKKEPIFDTQSWT
ncbi:uncharacterized protein VTP21DRAFT_1835 [Calcarisporiella thermophila]|uniref:uncharacterized protein n=1 Tax=Calcarisporiella thermophila TaxID=911321 RepID=UPI0037425E13